MALNTEDLTLPGTSLGIVTESALDGGLLPKLVPSKPTLFGPVKGCLLYTSPSPRDVEESRMPSSA